VYGCGGQTPAAAPAERAPEEPPARVVVTLADDGGLTAGGAPVTLDQLDDRIIELESARAALAPPDASEIGGWGHSGPVVVDGWRGEPRPGDVWVVASPAAEAHALIQAIESIWPQKLVVAIGDPDARWPYRFGLLHDDPITVESTTLVVGLRNLTLENGPNQAVLANRPDGAVDAAALDLRRGAGPYLLEARPRATVAQLGELIGLLAARDQTRISLMDANVWHVPSLITTGKARIEGSLTESAVRSAVRGGRLRACYQDALEIDPSIEATVIVRFTVAADGAVGGVEVTDGVVEPELTACLATALAALRFDPPPATPTKVEVPLELRVMDD
jgi:hypothetical protein